MKKENAQKFISEPLRPVVATADPRAMAAGGPGLPAEFTWRKGTLKINALLSSWTETGPCRHGSSESYVRKHWFEVEIDGGCRAQIYFERQARDRNRYKRWWLFSMGS